MSHLRRMILASLLSATLLSSCTSEQAPAGPTKTPKATGQVDRDIAPAVWELDRTERLTDASTSFTALVTRLGCNSGVTGDVVQPVVDITKSHIIVTFQVTPGEPKAADCPSNDLVPYEIELGEPVSGRRLMDGHCQPGGAAEDTALCEPSRWKP